MRGFLGCVLMVLVCAWPAWSGANIKAPGPKEVSRTTFKIKIPTKHIQCAYSPAGDFKRESIDVGFPSDKWVLSTTWDTEAGQLYDYKTHFDILKMGQDCKALQSAVAKVAVGGVLEVAATRSVTLALSKVGTGCLAQWDERLEATLPLGLVWQRVRRFEAHFEDKAGQCSALPESPYGVGVQSIRFHPQAASSWGIQCVRQGEGVALAFVPNVTNEVNLVSKRRFAGMKACQGRRAAIIKAAERRDPSNNGETIALRERLRLDKVEVGRRKVTERVHVSTEAVYEGEQFLSEVSFEIW